jgi:hypothetical protein
MTAKRGILTNTINLLDTLPTFEEEKLLEANRKYVEANWMAHDPKGSLDHAYYHGQIDLLEELGLRERLGLGDAK